METNYQNYSIGLDIGTNSVGWAVVNSDTFKVMQRGRKALWGVRLFEEAHTAVDRRTARGTRRRYDRRRKRIKLLQDLFRDEIMKIDPLFFKKLQESFYSPKDKVNKTIQMTPEDHKIMSDYYEKYPTIYHVRKAVIDGTETDIRLVYLALHHIIKYRGNFLYEGDFKIKELNISSALKNIFNTLEECNDTLENLNVELINYDDLEQTLRIESRIDRGKMIREVLKEVAPKNFVNEFSKAMLGNQFNIVTMLGLDDDNLKTSFKESDFDDNLDSIEKVSGKYIDVLTAMQELYNQLFLVDLFKGEENPSISELMVKRYNKHKDDLKHLKELLRVNKKEYHKIFKTRKKDKKDAFCEYDKYIHNQSSLDEFQKVVRSALINIYGEEIYQNQYAKFVENNDFMPRITDSDNGKYPYQLNKEELLSIIRTQGNRYPFLLDKVERKDDKEKEDNLYKLVKILSFRIPYYVGPLNDSMSEKDSKNPNAWIQYKVKGTNQLITPYNFEDLVDLDASAELFIKRMLSRCTYLLNEDAMPTNSLLYSKFKVLNELKQITINDHRLIDFGHDFFIKVYRDLFLKKGSVTEKTFVDYLRMQPDMSMFRGEFVIKGYSAEKKFANSMQSYVDFFGTDGIFENTLYGIDDAEQIIEWITIFEDKKMLERKIRKSYPNLSDKQISKCVSKRYKGWSSLSRKLLTEIKNDDGKSIMDLLEGLTDDASKQGQNFMQILNDLDYHFQEKIAEANQIEDNTGKISYDVVDELATSPANKRGIYQALKVVEEVVDYMGYEPKNICVEMSRGDDKIKQRKDNRKKYLENLYKNNCKDVENYNRLMKTLEDTEDSKFSNEKVFLYFIQHGKSLYSGEPIDIAHLEECEVDHIIPRTLIKDDSWDNKALVFRNENQTKAASLVLPESYRTDKNKKWWKMLLNQKLISKKKFYSLVRSQYSEKDIEGFIQRQLVETRQIIKHVVNILKSYHKDSTVVYLNTGLSHNYRDRFDLFKFRDINDYHHAHDAYLAAVLGIYQKDIFKQSIDIDLVKEQTKKLYDTKQYKELGYGLVINSINNEYLKYDKKTGEVKTNFDADYFNHLVCDTLYRNDILISRKRLLNNGKFYKEKLHSRDDKGTFMMPIKSNLSCEIYGSYQDISISHCILVEYFKKNKVCRKLVGIPTIYAKTKNINRTVIDAYIKSQLGISTDAKYTVLNSCIPFDSLLNYSNQLVYLKGYSVAKKGCELSNAYEFKMTKCMLAKYKYLLNIILNNKKESMISENVNGELKLIPRFSQEEYFNQSNDLIIELITYGKQHYPLFDSNLNKLINYRNIHCCNYEENQEIIKQLFTLYNCNSVNANFKFISGMTEREGRLSAKNVTSGVLHFKSISGLYKRDYEF